MNYKVTIETVTPLHLGTGQELLAEYDFVADSQQNRTYRLNVNAILDQALGEDAQLNEQILRSRPGQLARLEELRAAGSKLVVYQLKGRPQSDVVKEQVKDAWGRLYLPGSCVKGALRTAIGRYLAADARVRSRWQIPAEARAKFADDVLDQVIFGKTPNLDILRALRVADSEPVNTSPELINVSVVKGSQVQAPIDVEAVPAQTMFETTIYVDEYLYQERRKVAVLERDNRREWVHPARKLGWAAERVEWLGDLDTALPIFGRNMAQQRLRQEAAYFRRAGLARLASLYEGWQKQLQEWQGQKQSLFLLQLGWAGGWDSKTLGRHLLAQGQDGKFDEAGFAGLRTRFALGRPPTHKGPWQAQAGRDFPASRRLAVNEQGQPAAPLGWVKVEIRPA